MAKSMTVGKRENEKKRLAKREEKLKKKESKKLSGSSNSFEDMIAYVDENGMITSTPPTEDIKKEEINPDEITSRIILPFFISLIILFFILHTSRIYTSLYRFRLS